MIPVLAIVAVVALFAVIGSPSTPAGDTGLLGLVEGLERLDGCRPQIRAAFEDWNVNGYFPIVVPDKVPASGLRTNPAEQAGAAAGGLSKATDLRSTPHGRGAGADAWCKEFDPNGVVTQEIYAKQKQLADFMRERHSLVWGGLFTAAFPPTKANPFGGDLVHFQEEEWWLLPYPYTPSSSGGVA